MNGLRHRLTDDTGTSLMELIVGMGVMAIFMGMFTAAMLQMSNTTNKVEAMSNTTTQLTNAFLTLDREIRYATGVSQPLWSAATPGWHVEFSRTQIDRTTGSTATQSTYCTQLRIYQRQLWQRTWRLDSSNAAVSGSGSDWKPLAGGLDPATNTQAAAVQPFVLQPAAAGSGLQQLTVNLSSVSTAPGSATSNSSTTFTALNTSPASGAIVPSAVCQQVAPEAVKP